MLNNFNSLMNKKILQKNSGFTVIELVISIFILSIAIIGAYNAFTTMDILTSSATDRFIAAYLAQEGVEVVRNIRDTNWLNTYDWRCGIADVSGSALPCSVGSVDCTAGCEVNYKTFGTSSSPLYPWSGTGRYLYLNSNGFYVYESENATLTKFRRKVTITPIETVTGVYDILKVAVTTYWDEKANILHSGTTEDSITVEEYLYNWY
jgi:prepilin-type N-terminal cleavage/methylation domain-containing protein